MPIVSNQARRLGDSQQDERFRDTLGGQEIDNIGFFETVGKSAGITARNDSSLALFAPVQPGANVVRSVARHYGYNLQGQTLPELEGEWRVVGDAGLTFDDLIGEAANAQEQAELAALRARGGKTLPTLVGGFVGANLGPLEIGIALASFGIGTGVAGARSTNFAARHLTSAQNQHIANSLRRNVVRAAKFGAATEVPIQASIQGAKLRDNRTDLSDAVFEGVLGVGAVGAFSGVLGGLGYAGRRLILTQLDPPNGPNSARLWSERIQKERNLMLEAREKGDERKALSHQRRVSRLLLRASEATYRNTKSRQLRADLATAEEALETAGAGSDQLSAAIRFLETGEGAQPVETLPIPTDRVALDDETSSLIDGEFRVGSTRSQDDGVAPEVETIDLADYEGGVGLIVERADGTEIILARNGSEGRPDGTYFRIHESELPGTDIPGPLRADAIKGLYHALDLVSGRPIDDDFVRDFVRLLGRRNADEIAERLGPDVSAKFKEAADRLDGATDGGLKGRDDLITPESAYVGLLLNGLVRRRVEHAVMRAVAEGRLADEAAASAPPAPPLRLEGRVPSSVLRDGKILGDWDEGATDLLDNAERILEARLSGEGDTGGRALPDDAATLSSIRLLRETMPQITDEFKNAWRSCLIKRRGG